MKIQSAGFAILLSLAFQVAAEASRNSPHVRARATRSLLSEDTEVSRWNRLVERNPALDGGETEMLPLIDKKQRNPRQYRDAPRTQPRQKQR